MPFRRGSLFQHHKILTTLDMENGGGAAISDGPFPAATRALSVLIESEPGSNLLFLRVFFTRTGVHFARKRSSRRSRTRSISPSVRRTRLFARARKAGSRHRCPL